MLNDNILAYITRYNGFVQMLTDDVFLQITNCKENIAFANNIQVDLIDICQNVVKSLTVNENFYYNEFTDIKGVKQIAYAFGNICEDFGAELLFLRLKHTVSDNVWYSAGFFVTDDLKEETTFIKYKAEGYFKGIDYSNQNFFQRIRVTCFFTDIDPQTETEDLTQISGNRYGLRSITTRLKNYLFYTCDFFTYDRMVALLSHPIVYIDGFRANTKASDLSKGERVTDTNFFDANFSVNPTEEEDTIGYEIYERLECIYKNPSGEYILDDYNAATASSSLFRLQFNKPISIASDINAKLYKDGVLFATFGASKFSVSGADLNIDVSASPITDTGTYVVVIEPNKVISGLEKWGGFTYGEWQFYVQNGYYNSTFYNSTTYNTN